MTIFKADQPMAAPATGQALSFTTFVASVIGHAVIVAGILLMGLSEFSPPQPEAIIVDLVFETSGASSNKKTRSEPKSVAVFSEITEPAPPQKPSVPDVQAIISEMPAGDLEASIPVILTASTSIIEPAPIVPKPVKEAVSNPKKISEKKKDLKKRQEKTTKLQKKSHKIKIRQKKKQIASRASLPGKGQKQKGRAQKIQTQGARYSGAGLSNPRPRYPPSARRKRVQGRVLLAVVVSKSGRTSSVRVRKSSGFEMLDQAALKTVKRWRFKPATRNGRPVRARVIVPITFKLKG